VAEVEVDEVLSLCLRWGRTWLAILGHFDQRGVVRVSRRTVSDEAAKVADHDAVPGRPLPLVKLWETCVS
jgi:hypothetical protein